MKKQGRTAIAVHGGAGTLLRSEMTPELEHEYRRGIEAALHTGWEILERGGSSLDAVEASICSLEDFPLFNAGRGSVFTAGGVNEMDAAIMDGSNLRAGAVSIVRNIRNPIRLARLVLERTEHVLLAGEGANQFAAEMGVETAPDEYFFTEHRWLQLQNAIAAGRFRLDHAKSVPAASAGGNLSEPGAATNGFFEVEINGREGEMPGKKAETRPEGGVSSSVNPKSKIQNPTSLGTVGAVACDANGRLAAATSTGGMTNKKFGRIGDTPLIGAGTYADDVCAVSCTGHGEYFMLGVSAYDVAARMKYKALPLEVAARETIEHLTSIGGEGGLIAVDPFGNVTSPFNSEGMYRGSINIDGQVAIHIHR